MNEIEKRQIWREGKIVGITDKDYSKIIQSREKGQQFTIDEIVLKGDLMGGKVNDLEYCGKVIEIKNEIPKSVFDFKEVKWLKS